jgi:hypothetical protein
MPDHVPDTGVVFTQHLSDSFDRHIADYYHDEGFNEQAKAAVGTRPGKLGVLDAAVRALDARFRRMKKRLVLKVVQMPSRLRVSVVNGNSFATADRTVELASFGEAKVNVETLIGFREGDLLDLPGCFQAKSLGKQNFYR